MTTESDASDNESQQTKPAPSAPEFSLARVIITVLLLVLLGGGVFFLLQEAGPPPLVTYSGQIFYKGQPLTGGGVFTEPLNSKLIGAVGGLEKDGRFTLMTNGEPGAYVGKHKLAVSVMSGGSPPSPLIPGRYTQIHTTPLIIEVHADPAKNKAEFKVEEEETTEGAQAASGDEQATP